MLKNVFLSQCVLYSYRISLIITLWENEHYIKPNHYFLEFIQVNERVFYFFH